MTSRIKTETDQGTFMRMVRRSERPVLILVSILLLLPLASFIAHCCQETPEPIPSRRNYEEVMREYEWELFCETHSAALNQSIDSLASCFPPNIPREKFAESIFALYRKRFLASGSSDFDVIPYVIKSAAKSTVVGEKGPTVAEVIQLASSYAIQKNGSIEFPINLKIEDRSYSGCILLSPYCLTIRLNRGHYQKGKQIFQDFKFEFPISKTSVS